MKKKINKSFLSRKRKQLKPNSVAVTKLISFIKKEFKKQLQLSKNPTVEEALEAIQQMKLLNVDRYIERLGNEVLRKNRDGYKGILEALAEGVAIQKKQQKAQREEELFKQALPSLIQEQRIYGPLLNKFVQNMQLIKNLPHDVENALRKAYLKCEGFRGQDIEQYILDRMGKRAGVIIRTESSKLNSALTEVRSRSLGINCYIWSTSGDVRVRPSHKMMDGVLVFYNMTPELDDMKGHAGEYPNCRCVPLAVFDIEDITFPVKVAENVVIASIYNKKTKTSRAKIISGKIATYNKQQFIEKYSVRG